MSTADVCLIVEGSYPYVAGGVSTWTHELITRQNHLTFHIVALLPRDEAPKMRYELPSNVTGFTTLHLQKLPVGTSLPKAEMERLFDDLRPSLINMTTGEATLEDFRQMMETVAPYHGKIGSKVMLDSEAAWALTTSMYEESFAHSSMLDYFWSWRAVLGGIYSLMVADLPPARCYHALSTGYAGILAARAKVETGRPVIITEHGIYTNERRIEISAADWLEQTSSKAMTIDQTHLDLRDMWTVAFANYSRIAYQAADHIITLYTGNQIAQLADGAPPERMQIIPNGIDVGLYGALRRKEHGRPTVALIGRVVPIKDVKNFLRAVAALSQSLPDVRALIMGPTDEDLAYYYDCKAIVEYFALQKNVEFTGRVKIEEYLPEIDVLVSSSISEAQPLVILEAGASGVPAVATDVGACREMIMGKEDEKPALGQGGVVVPLSNPQALAEAIFKLLTDNSFYTQCSNAIRQRVATSYNKQDQYMAYKELYASCTKKG